VVITDDILVCSGAVAELPAVTLPPTLHITLTASLSTVLLFLSCNTIMGIDYYKLLGVGRDASEDDIKKAYKKMVGTTFLTGRASLIFTIYRH
jgi:hypothetical protein